MHNACMHTTQRKRKKERDRAHTCVYVCVCVCVCAYMYLYMYVCMYVRMYVRMCVCMYVCIYVSKVLPTRFNKYSKVPLSHRWTLLNSICEMVSYYNTLISAFSWTYWKCFNQEPSRPAYLLPYFQIAIIPYKFPYGTNIKRCHATDDH